MNALKARAIEAVVQSDPSLLQALRGLVRAYARSRGFNANTVDNIVLAVDEACANSIRHAYSGCVNHALRLCLGEEDDSIVIEVSDEGRPAPREKFEKRLTEPPADSQDVKPGGLGIPLMQEIFDSVEFDCGETQGNRVRLRLRRPDTGSG